MTARDRLIVALDHPSAGSALEQVDELGELVDRYKVGLELFLAEGRSLVAELRARDKRVFVDLKLHDIPETVRRAARVVAGLDAELLSVHASGGQAMLEAAVEGAGSARVLAVTVLTSLDLADLGRDLSAAPSTSELVLARARLAKRAGCAGVIASPREAALLRRELPSPFLIVTPGVRRDVAADDQKRVGSPKQAISDGADAVVVGRPIRDAKDRRAEAERFLQELA